MAGLPRAAGRRRREPRREVSAFGAGTKPGHIFDRRAHALRLRGGHAGREDAARARRVRLGRRPLRRDERPHVGRHAPAVEALRGRPRPACARASACSTSRAAPATSRACSRARSGPSGTVVHTDINHAMLADGRDKLIDRGLMLPTVQCNAEALPFRDAHASTCVVDRLRPAQRDAQGRGARGDAARAAAGRRRLVLEFSRVAPPLAPLYDWYSFNVLPRLGKLVAERRRELPLPRGVDPRAPRPGGARADDGTGGLRPCRIPQPYGRRGRRARRAGLLTSGPRDAIFEARWVPPAAQYAEGGRT